MAKNGYRDLLVWQKSMNLVTVIYALARQLPDIERFALADQIRRSAVSVPSNIAEGFRRSSNLEFRRFCTIAHGSLAELETQLLIIDSSYYVDVKDELTLCDEVGRMLSGLIRSIESNAN